MGAYQQAFTLLETLRNQSFDDYQTLVSLCRDIISKTSGNKRNIIRDTPNKFLLAEAESLLVSLETPVLSVEDFFNHLQTHLEKGLKAWGLDHNGHIK